MPLSAYGASVYDDDAMTGSIFLWGNPVKKMPKKTQKEPPRRSALYRSQEEEEALRWLKSQTFQQPSSRDETAQVPTV